MRGFVMRFLFFTAAIGAGLYAWNRLVTEDSSY